MSNKKEAHTAQGLQVSRKTFLATVLLLLGIMVLAGILTRVLPQGSYDYILEDGRSVILPGSYHETSAPPLPIWRWFTAPLEVLFTGSATTAVMIMLFILFIGGSFLVLEQSGTLSYMIGGIIRRFEGKKYRLLAIITFVCMLLGSTIGLFEETVTLVPITVALALVLGWDSLVGIGMSVLAVGFGFAAGTLNPFTLGVTQNLADVPVFSGLLLRVVLFAVVYLLLVGFLYLYARRIEKDPAKSSMYKEDLAARQRYQSEIDAVQHDDPAKKKALRVFILALLLVLCYVVTGLFIPGLSDFAMPVMALLFTAGALVAGRVAGITKGLFKTFLKGVGSIAPSVLLILLAMSVTHIMQQGNILGTILHFFYLQIEHLGPYGGALALFALVLLMNFFIGSATAKAFMLIPILIPLADMIGITRQTAIQAFVMGDGFTNMLYPTNVVLLITLGLVGVPYGRWFRWTWKLQLCLLAVSVTTILFCVRIGYGPY